MKFLCLLLVVVVSSPALATLRLQELNRVGLTGKISDKLMKLGRGDLLLPITSPLLARKDSILLGSDERRRVAGRSAVVDYRRSQVYRLDSGLINKTAFAIYEQADKLYMLVVNIVNDYISVSNMMESLLLYFDHAMTTTRDLDEFVKQRALQRRGVYLAVAAIADNSLDVRHVGAQIDDRFWSSVYLAVVREGQIEPLTEVSDFSYEPAAGNNFMLMRRQSTNLKEGDSLVLFTGVNDFESSEVMLSAPRALDKHVAGNVNKLNYYLGEDSSSFGQLDNNELLTIADNGHKWWQEGESQELLEQLDNLKYTLLYYLHHP